MERILGGVVDITTPGYDGVKDVKAEVAEAKMSEKFNNVKLSVKYRCVRPEGKVQNNEYTTCIIEQ